ARRPAHQAADVHGVASALPEGPCAPLAAPGARCGEPGEGTCGIRPYGVRLAAAPGIARQGRCEVGPSTFLLTGPFYLYIRPNRGRWRGLRLLLRAGSWMVYHYL